MTKGGYRSYIEPTKDTAYLALTDKLWGESVYSESLLKIDLLCGDWTVVSLCDRSQFSISMYHHVL